MISKIGNKIGEEKSIKTIMLAAIILAFMISCTTNKTSGITEVNIHTGTDGMTAEFIKANPPETVYIDSGETEYSGFIKLENKGASRINTGYMNLMIEKDYTRFSENIETPIRFALDGKTRENPYGQQAEKIFMMASKLDTNSYSKKTQITAVFCHDYQTQAVEQVCIDPDILNKRVGQKVCTPQDKSLSSQGAPLAVTKIETRILSADGNLIPTFFIYVQNKGKGQVLNPNTKEIENACTNNAKSSTWNIVSAEAMLGNEKLECSPQPLHLKNKEDFIKCELKTGIDPVISAYMSTLQVTLDYGYTFTISTNVELKRTT